MIFGLENQQMMDPSDLFNFHLDQVPRQQTKELISDSISDRTNKTEGAKRIQFKQKSLFQEASPGPVMNDQINKMIEMSIQANSHLDRLGSAAPAPMNKKQSKKNDSSNDMPKLVKITTFGMEEL